MTTREADLRARCCVVGGGPAGMLLGVLLARAGVDVVVLEKHADFLRDFRGDTVHPSTLAILAQIGLLERFEALPQRRIERLSLHVGPDELPFADFRGLAPFPYIALVPQWDFLNLLADEGGRHRGFSLRMQTEAHALIRDAHGRVVGVEARGPDGALRIAADLVVGCDGRGSVLRDAAGLCPEVLGAPMDVLWFRIPRAEGDPPGLHAHIGAGRMMVTIDRGDYWQAAYVAPKGLAADLREDSARIRRDAAELVPFLGERAGRIDAGEAALLEVRVDRLREWHRPGLLMIGDAAHAMSPVGGVGINLAIQDAVAAANALAGPLRGDGAIADATLAAVAKRRLLPTRVVQRVQVVVQNRVIARALALRDATPRAPALARWLLRFRWVRSLPARFFGLGVRREYVRTPGPG